MIMHFPTVATGAPVAEPFTLVVSVCGSHSYRATFHRECDVIDFIQRRMAVNESLAAAGTYSGGYSWSPVEDCPLPESWEALDRLLFPTCEHGLSADLCWGPNHYPTADEERAMGW